MALICCLGTQLVVVKNSTKDFFLICMLIIIFTYLWCVLWSQTYLTAHLSEINFVDGVWRGDKLLNLKQIADGAMAICAER